MCGVFSSVNKKGMKILLFSRLSLPYTLNNYFLGVTSVAFWQFGLVTFLTGIPFALVYTAIGVELRDLETGTFDLFSPSLFSSSLSGIFSTSYSHILSSSQRRHYLLQSIAPLFTSSSSSPALSSEGSIPSLESSLPSSSSFVSSPKKEEAMASVSSSSPFSHLSSSSFSTLLASLEGVTKPLLVLGGFLVFCLGAHLIRGIAKEALEEEAKRMKEEEKEEEEKTKEKEKKVVQVGERRDEGRERKEPKKTKKS
ncbi:snare associated golgi protein [Cystoisospora suis]|uniref:Snare associated golgi protein n=1 Tax=Cystoisospora suis TaxID=483139 RepID=A0A2C6KJN8_9APIC|nr:snare associated golgi protein [Cystoisospora suis]